jgi:hypothetical protein
MVEGHPVGDPAAAVMPGDREALVPEHSHGLHLVGGKRAFGVRGVIGGRRRPERRAVPGQVGGDDREPVGQSRRGGVPHEVRLRVAVQEQQRRSSAADAREDHTPDVSSSCSAKPSKR